VRLAAVAALALALVPTAHAGTTTSVANPITTTTPLAQTQPRTTKNQAIALFVANDKVADWLKRYPPKPVTDATFKQGVWTVNVWSGKAGEIATGTVDDGTGSVVEAWTGPQVAWKMGRGYKGAFGGEKINSYTVWLGLCAIFLLYGLLVERGYRAGLALRDPFGRLLAVGLASIVALQVFVIAGGVTGLIPLTGMAMPFLAQGGSSLVTNWAIVALLIQVSHSARRQYNGEVAP